MLRVASCLTQEHDLRLVALAVLVWLLAAGISVRLLDDRDVEAGRRLRVGAAVVVSGAGVWAAQLVSILAFRPAVPFEFDVSPGVLAGIISIGATGLAFSIWPSVRGSLGRVAASGVALAAGIVASHLAGMVALQGLGVLQADLAVASFALTAVCSVGAMGLLARRQAVWGSVALMAGVLPGHVVAMGSLTFAGSTDAGPVLMSALAPALAIGGTGLVVMALAVATVAIERRFTLRLTRETRRFGVLADATLDGLIFERHGQIVGVNRVICELAKTEAGALIGRPVSELISGIDFRLSERGAPVERALQLRDGQSVLVDVSWTNGPDAGGRVLAVRDLSAVKAAEREIERLAHLDPLTGLANREVFEQALDQARVIAAQKGTGFAVLYADLDRFGLLIEALGHREAEQVLIQTAGRLSALVAGSGTVARLGRDAFAIIQPLVAHVRDPAVVAEAVLTDMAAPFAVDGHPIAITASIGLAVYPDDGTDPRNLLECAILAVCQAKREGRGRQCRFQPNMDLLLQEKRLLAQDLRIALQENQFSLDYQPFVDTVTLETVGYEALLRWDHPERGRIAPVDFIPLAEESGLIVPIGSWVLATACAEAAAWDDQTIISVNLSPAQFVQPGIVSTVADVLQRTGLPSSRLELEITESTLMDDTQSAPRILAGLKALGVKIAMDDFGTGYSSLSYLRKYPFDKIKIDRSFISDVEGGADAETIVQAIVAMGRSLRLKVTAEGVETHQQLLMLRALGCDFVQGYLVGRPRAAGQLGSQTVKATQRMVAVSGPRMVSNLRSA